MRGMPQPTPDEIHRDIAASCAAGAIEGARLSGMLPNGDQAAEKVRDLRRFLEAQFTAAIAAGLANARGAQALAPVVDDEAVSILQFWQDTLSQARALTQRERAPAAAQVDEGAVAQVAEPAKAERENEA